MDLNIFKANLFTPGLNGRWGLPRLYWGPPGVGKTAKIKQLCGEFGITVISISAATRDPSDILGIPMPEEHAKLGTVTRCAAPFWAVKAAEVEDSCIFFDEINTASKSTQNSLLTVMLDGVVGEYELPPTVRLMAAGNPEGMTGGGIKMNTALANRFGHENTNLNESGAAAITMEDVNNWAQWLLDSGESSPKAKVDGTLASAERERVKALWGPVYAQARAEVASFMLSGAGGASTLMNMPDRNDPRGSRAWASPRSWECATRALASGRIHGLRDDQIDNWMASHVGIGPIAAFRAHFVDMALPNPAELLDGRATWEFDKTRGDRTLAMMASCSSLLATEGEHTSAREDKYWQIMTLVVEQQASMAIPSAMTMIGAGMCSSKASAKPMAKLRVVLKAAGAVRSR